MPPILQKLDLNLLTVLDTLLEERSVGRTAARLYLTQPAVSNALARLREMLGDPLLVKAGGGMEPTERALALIAPVREALASIETAVRSARAFDPSTTQAEIRIAMGDYAAEIFLPRMVNRFARRAPGLVVAARYVRLMPVEVPLACSDNHLVVARGPAQGETLRSMFLLREPFKLVARPDHPGIKGKLTLDEYCNLPHAVSHLITTDARTPLDDLLAAMGKARRVAVKVGMPMPIVNAETDFVATQPETMARALAAQRGLSVHDLPFDMPPGELHLLWHRKYETSSLHEWVRNEIEAMFAELPQAPEHPSGRFL
jgi:DNA-binding transcriptional LysR family regulator